jgi:amino acid transporter
MVSTIISLLLALINIGSTAAFNGIMSVNVAAFFSSYMIAITLLLHKRLRNDPEKDTLRWGPWHMGPVFGPFVNVVGLAYTTTTMFCNQPISLFPCPELPASLAGSMRYAPGSLPALYLPLKYLANSL